MYLLLILVSCDSSIKLEPAAGKDSAPVETVDDTGVTDDTGPAAPDLGFTLSGAWSGSTLVLTMLVADSLGDEALEFGATRWSAPGATEILLTAGEPPEEDLVPLDPENAPGTLAAFYVPTLHLDADGDGLQNDDEVFVGVGDTWALYIRNLGANMPLPGLVEGWNAIHVDFLREDIRVADPMTIPVDASLAEMSSIALAGTTSVDLPDDSRFGVYPSIMFEGGIALAGLLDEPASESWSFSLEAPPPDDHFSDLDGLYAAVELPLIYQDSHPNERLDDGDQLLHPVCAEGHAVGLLYIPPPTDLVVATSMTIYGIAPGWLATAFDEEGLSPFSADALLNLDIGSCSF